MQLPDAAETLGVHYQTAYGWVRQGTLPARKTARGYEVSESDVRGLMTRRAAGTEPPREVRVRDWAAQVARMYAALVAGDEARARDDFARLAAGVPLAGLCDQIIAPALRRIGADWAAGCLREDHWQVHHLAADLPVAEVTGFAADAGASLIVLSSATTGAARLASREAREIGEQLPHARILAGRPGDTLGRLRELARTPRPAAGR